MKQNKNSNEKGSIALEYVLVTTFATVLAIALLGMVTHVSQDQIQKLATKLGFDMGRVDLDPWGGG